MTKIKYGNPPHLVCFICDDDGLCRNNIFSTYYDERLFGDTDYLDCIVYLRNKEDRPTEASKSLGKSMVGFMPEMIGSSVIIYGKYYNLVDSVKVHIK